MEGSAYLKMMFTALGVALALLFSIGVWQGYVLSGAPEAKSRRALAMASIGSMLWLVVTYVLAREDRLRFEGVPPTMLVIVVLTFILTIRIGRSETGLRMARGIPLAVLVGVQAFRLPLELMMHKAYAEGVMPVQMSYSGYNFDIITGITALIVAALLASGKAGPRLARAWNWMGLALLVNVLVIAFLSAPLPFRRFMNEPANTWVTHEPFVWLPTVMVAMALLGHIVIFRNLAATDLRR